MKNNVYKNFIKWISIILFLVLSVLNFIRIDSQSHSASDTLRPFFIQVAILALIFILIFQILNKKLKV